jgi:hypothetical protein
MMSKWQKEQANVAIDKLEAYPWDWLDDRYQPRTHKLKAKWNVELAQDLSAYHDIDVEAEYKKMAQDLADDIDREILEKLKNE